MTAWETDLQRVDVFGAFKFAIGQAPECTDDGFLCAEGFLLLPQDDMGVL